MEKCVVTRSLDEFKSYLDPRILPVLARNDALSFDFATAPPGRTPLYVIKPQAGASLASLALDPGSCVAQPDDLRALRVFLVNEMVYARERNAVDHDPSYERLLSSFDDPAFMGVLIINVVVMPKVPASLGPSAVVGCFWFVAPCLELTGFDFSDAVPKPCDTQLRGYVVGQASGSPFDVHDEQAGFAFRLESLCASFANSRLYTPRLTCGLQILSLFSQAVRAGPVLRLLGTYAPTTQLASPLMAYRFVLAQREELRFAGTVVESMGIERAAVMFEAVGAHPHLRLACEGFLRFANTGELFDPLSYGDAEDADSCGHLSFSGLELVLCLDSSAPRLDAVYRSIALDECSSHVRKSSLAQAIPHAPASFLCFQHAPHPRDMGFRPLTTPSLDHPALPEKQPWYGVVFPVEYSAGIRIELLVAFTGSGALSCFFRFAGGVGGAVTELAFSSLFSLRLKDASLQVADDGAYSLWLRGVKVGVLGLQVPEGACDAALIWSGKKRGWYAVYDHRVHGEHTENGGLLKEGGGYGTR